MADKYNCKVVGWLGRRKGCPNGYAITIGQTTYYSVSSLQVAGDPTWRRHEDRHKWQWKEEGFLRFLVMYLWYSFTLGYDLNPYELDAREAEKRVGSPLKKK